MSCTPPPTYYNRVVKEKWTPEGLTVEGRCRDLSTHVQRRVRGTAGGDRLHCPHPVSTPAASLSLVNVLLNAVVSEDAFFGSLDLTDFYLGTDLPTPSFVKIYTATFPRDTLSSLSPLSYLQHGANGKEYILFRIAKTMYGLKEAGILSNHRVTSILRQSGFMETTTPCLFRHHQRKIDFALVVGDYGVKYHRKEDFDFLASCLSSYYHVKAHPTSTPFLGLTIAHDRPNRTLTVSYPGFIQKMLSHLRPNGVKSAPTPYIYSPPAYGRTGPQPTNIDTSPPATPEQKLELQTVIGYLLFYGRAVDSRFLPATSFLSSFQSAPTLNSLKHMERLLQYASANPNGCRIYKPSDMVLRIYSDASFNSRPKSGSTAGSFHYLGSLHDTVFSNAPISCHTTLIPIICASAMESEYAGIFAAAKIACHERHILECLGYPQPPTPLACDNECAVNLSNRHITPKHSKSINLRFHWIQDRIAWNQFHVYHVPGIVNVADFFTKPLPLNRYLELAPSIATTPLT